MQLTCELVCWLLLVTLFVNAAAAKLTMKTTNAITNNRKRTSRDLLLIALIVD